MTEPSTKWWNVIRRKVRAVKPVKERFDITCPDCGNLTHMMEGKYGRFYRCDYYLCQGTHGAKLDGTPRNERGSPEELEARDQTRVAIHKFITEIIRRRREADRITYDYPYNYGLQLEDIKKILLEAEVSFDPKKPGFHLRKRTIEECRRIEDAAEHQLRLSRRNAWDHIILDELAV